MLDIENGLAGNRSDSYVAIVDVDIYAEKYNKTAWLELAKANYSEDELDKLKEAYIRQATRYIDGTYSDKFTGQRTYAEQGLCFPRKGATIEGMAIDDNIVPYLMHDANCEVACLLAEGKELYPDTEPQIKIEMVDILKSEYFEQSGNVSKAPTLEAILKPILKPRQGMRSILISMG